MAQLDCKYPCQVSILSRLWRLVDQFSPRHLRPTHLPRRESPLSYSQGTLFGALASPSARRVTLSVHDLPPLKNMSSLQWLHYLARQINCHVIMCGNHPRIVIT